MLIPLADLKTNDSLSGIKDQLPSYGNYIILKNFGVVSRKIHLPTLCDICALIVPDLIQFDL